MDDDLLARTSAQVCEEHVHCCRGQLRSLRTQYRRLTYSASLKHEEVRKVEAELLADAVVIVYGDKLGQAF